MRCLAYDMPFFFILIGFGLVVIGYRGTQHDFYKLLQSDFSGQNNFFVFALGLFIVGLIGYVPKLKGLSNAFLVLVLIVILLSQKKQGSDFFSLFLQQIRGTQTDSTDATTSNTSIQVPGLPSIPSLVSA